MYLRNNGEENPVTAQMGPASFDKGAMSMATGVKDMKVAAWQNGQCRVR